MPIEKPSATPQAEPAAVLRRGLEETSAIISQAQAAARQNAEAATASFAAAQKGAEVVRGELLALAEQAMGRQLAAAAAISKAKSLPEVFELQSSYTRQTFEAYTAGMTKIVEAMSLSTREAISPLSERFSQGLKSQLHA